MTQPKVSQRRNQLSMRLMLATLLYSLIITLVVSGTRIYWAYTDDVRIARAQLAQIETSYIPSLSASLWEVNHAHLNLLMDGIARLPYVDFVELSDDAGTLWTRNPRQNQTTEYILSVKTFPLSHTVNGDHFELGSLHVELSSREIIENLRRSAIGIAISTSIILLLTVAIIFLLFQRWVTRHLEKMAEFAQQLDVNHLDQPLRLDRSEHATKDELDLVVDAINHMQVSIKADLQNRIHIEQELRLHKEHLEQLVQERTLELEAQNRELDAYAHSVAHDLKTPLTTIVARAQLAKSMASSLTPEQIQESAASIHRTSVKMTHIINALLLLASIRREDDIRTTSIDLKTLALEACERVNHHAKENHASIEFVGNWVPALGFSQWVEEVWVNYISNAIKYGGTPPRIEIGCESLGNGFNKYWVRDHGKGIASEHQAQLFVQFSRINPTSSDGHGLGLSIVKRIVERLQGEVGYENAEGGGGIFWFTLPEASQPPQS